MASGYLHPTLAPRESSPTFEQAAHAVSRRQDTILLVVAILLNAGLWMFTPHEDPEAGSPIAQGILGLMYLVAIFGVFRERKTAWPLLMRSQPLLLLVAFAVVSTIWSEEPFITLRRSYELLGFGAVSLYFACRMSVRSFIVALATALSVAAVISLFLIFAVPSVGRMQLSDILTETDYIGAWRGIFPHKNGLGEVMVIGILTVSTIVSGTKGLQRIGWFLSIALMTGLLIGSHSITAVLEMMAIAVIIAILLWSRKLQSLRPAVLITFGCCFIALFSMLIGFGPDEILALVGRDSTLTGRTEIWGILLNAIDQRPLIGWGYQAFFVANEIGSWNPGHAHNGLLEIALDLGIVGVILGAGVLFVWLRRSWGLFWQGRGLISAWPLFALLYVAFTNIADDTFSTADARWFLVVGGLIIASRPDFFIGPDAAEGRDQVGLTSGEFS